MSHKALSAIVGSLLIGAAFASPAIAGDDSEARFADHSTYSSGLQAGTAAGHKIVGTGLRTKKIVGTGLRTKKIVGTGVRTKKIVGTGTRQK
jgi:hypothetical protein